MKKRNTIIVLVAALIAIGVSVSFYNYSTYANEQDYQAQVSREKKEADLLFVDSVTLKTSKHETITADELGTLTRANRIGKVTALATDDTADLRKLVPGSYTVDLTIEMPSKVVIHRSADVIVKDDVAPKITVADELSVANGAEFPLDKVTATDASDGQLPADQLQITGYDSQKAGAQKVTIEARDHAGNLATQQVTVTVAAKIPEPEDKPAAEANSDTPDATEEKGTPQAEATEEPTPATASASEASETAAELTQPETNEAKATPETTQETQSQTESATANQAPDANSDSVETADSASVSEPAPAPAPAPVTETARLQFAGVSVPFVQSQGVGAAPATGAGAWMGNGSTTDVAPTHFIGHNPGDFAAVMSLGVGSTITVTDASGNTRSYTVYEVLDVTDDGYNNANPADDVYPRMLYAGGERISLQTCITDTVNRCVLAK